MFVIDFTKLFDWNTKELFVYAAASYATEAHVGLTDCWKLITLTYVLINTPDMTYR